MGIYIVLLSVIIVYSIIIAYNDKNNKNAKITFLCISAISLLLVMGLRGINVGTDTELYCNIFKMIDSAKDLQIFDVAESAPFYAVYNKVISIFFGNKNSVVIFFNSFIIITLMVVAIYKNSKNVYMSIIYYVLFYFYLQGFNIARQCIAGAIMFNSFDYIVNKNLKKYAILSIIAVLIHNTSVIFVILGLILMYIKPNIKNTILVGTIISIIGLFFNKVINIFLIIFPRYQMYFTTKNIFFETGQGRKIIITFIYIIVVISGLYILNKNKNKNNNQEDEEYKKAILLTNFIIVAIIIGILSLKSLLISRIEIYFSIFIITYLPMIIEKTGKYKYLLYMMSIVIMFIPFYVLLKSNNSGVVPYIFLQ